MKSDPPQWAIDCVREWAERLGISHWSIHLQMETIVNGDEAVMALTTQLPHINKCVITLRLDAEDTVEWHVTIVHELIHVAHSVVDHLIETACGNYMGRKQGVAVLDAYTLAYEQFVHRLAEAIVRNVVGESE